MSKASKLKLPKLGKARYSDVQFYLHWIGRISVEPGKNFYEAKFRSIKPRNNFTISDEIPPEILKNYVIGNIYQQGGLTGTIKNRKQFPVTLPEGKSRIVRIKDIPRPETESPPLDAEVADQYALLSEDGGYSIVIPCHVIGSAFYFTSTVMRKRVFDTRIEELYQDIGFDEEKNLPYIELKSNVSDRDAAYVYFYATDEYANRTWHAIRNNLFIEYEAKGGPSGAYGKFPLKIEPPFTKTVGMLADGIIIEQRKIKVVYDILELETPLLDYGELIVRRRSGGGIRESAVEFKDAVFRTRARTDRTISHERPSWKNWKKGVVNDAGGDVFSSIGIVKDTIADGSHDAAGAPGRTADNVVHAGDGQARSLSFNLFTDSRNTDVSQAEASISDREQFTFEDFRELIGMFIDKYAEHIKDGSTGFSGPSKMPADAEKGYLNEKDGYDRKDSVREYMTARFGFKGKSGEKHVLLIELSQKNSVKGFSTFILISGKVMDFELERNFLREYASGEPLDRIAGVFRRLGVKLARKKHPDKGDKDKSFKAWCRDLERKLNP